MRSESEIKASFEALEGELSRRVFFRTALKGAGVAAALAQFGPKLFAQQDDPQLPYKVYSELGKLIIPVDEDPGWETFEPGITEYGLNVFVKQVLLGGNFLAFLGMLGSLSAINSIPVLTNYGVEFLKMTPGARDTYFQSILTGQFENDGVGDLVGFAGGLTLISTKGTFFSNYPKHRAVPGAEFQVRTPGPVKTGWDIMRLKGPVGPAEEAQLRAKYFDAEELPGVDPTNKYI